MATPMPRNSRIGKTSKLLADDTIATSDGSLLADARYVAIEDASSMSRQRGYKRDWLGSLAFASLMTLSIGMFVWLFMIVLDFYGMHVWTLCDEAAREVCRDARGQDDYFTARTGFACGSGCLFSWSWTTGASMIWPYFRNWGGGHQIDLVFIISWHVVVLWVLILKALQSKIRSFFKIRCPLEQATTVLITRPKEKEIFIEQDSFVMQTVLTLDRFRDKWFGGAFVTEACRVSHDNDRVPYIDVQSLRHCWSPAAGKFVRSQFVFGRNYAEIRSSSRGLSTAEAKQRYDIIGSNLIPTRVPSFSQSMFHEFFDWFYIYQIMCLWVWAAFYYWQMSLAIFIAVFASGLVKVHTRRVARLQVKALAERTRNLTVMRDGTWRTLSSDEVVPGDLIKVDGNHEELLVDAVLLTGSLVLDESSLTGEPTPVSKVALPTSGEDSKPYSASGDMLKYSLFAGTSVDSVTAASNGYASAVVIATGASTQKGQLLRCLMYPAPLSFKFDQHWKLVFLILLAWGIIVFFICVRMVHGNLVGWYYGVSTISQIMSPLIPAVFVASRANSARRLKKYNDINCTNFDRVPVCGKIKIFCFDKTGTLTEPGLDFEGVLPVNTTTIQFAPPVPVDALHNHSSGVSDIVKLGMACAHELTLTGMRGTHTSTRNEVVGNEVDRELFAASGYEMVIEMPGTIWIRGALTSVKVLKRFQFARTTMSMSCVVEDSNDPESRYVFTKGSYESIHAMCNPASTPESYKQDARRLARDGYYVLGLAYKTYNGPANIEGVDRESIESDLVFLGLIIYSNKLKPSAASVLRQLKAGSIRPVMLTGDSALTAVKVARQSGLSTATQIVLGDTSDDCDALIDWRDVDTGEAIEPFVDRWRDLETGHLELALTGAAFKKLGETPMTQTAGVRDAFSDYDITSNSDEVLMSSQLRCLLRYTRIFARMSPDQKVQAVKLHMLTGVTAMCGDGSNDVGALRIAHVGLALGNMAPPLSQAAPPQLNNSGHGTTRVKKHHKAEMSDAVIVAPFSSTQSSLDSVIAIAKEGRCSLATALAGYKNLMVYGEVMVAVSFIMYYFGVNLSEAYWVTVDAVINIGMAWAVLQSRPALTLSSIRPSSKLLGSEVVSSVLLQLSINIIFLVIAMAVLFEQDFFVCREFDANLVNQGQWWKKADNYEAAVLAVLSYFQLLNAAAIFNFGFDYRASWHKNRWLVSFWVIGYMFGLILFLFPTNALSCLYRINCGDQSLLERWKDLNKIAIFGMPSTAPIGCPCDTQIDLSPTCEYEYIGCQRNQFNQTYHHNIMPYDFRLIFLMLILLNTLIGFALEAFFIVGPVRQKMRQRKTRHRTQEKLVSAQRTEVSAPFGTAFVDGPISNRLRSPSVIVGGVTPLRTGPSHLVETTDFLRGGAGGLAGVGIGGVGVGEPTGDNMEGEISNQSQLAAAAGGGAATGAVGGSTPSGLHGVLGKKRSR